MKIVRSSEQHTTLLELNNDHNGHSYRTTSQTTNVKQKQQNLYKLIHDITESSCGYQPNRTRLSSEWHGAQSNLISWIT